MSGLISKQNVPAVLATSRATTLIISIATLYTYWSSYHGLLVATIRWAGPTQKTYTFKKGHK